ncbi:hypothetical protein CIB48_g1638 [Xylaria polymorpha]|nr:hypothetical protein CIB48_g1638 [Xylaria polymorpha]
MRQGELINTIGRNNARDNATQYNILIIAPFIENALKRFRGPDDKTDIESTQILGDFLSSALSMKETPRANSHNHFDTHRSTELASSDSRCFEMLAKFGNSCSKSIEDYCPSSCLAIEVLERKHLEMIARWLASSGSTTLLVDVENERCGPSWATDFVLEMVDIFKPANGGSQVSFGALVTHYCRTENSMNYGEEGVLQGILAQIIEANPERLKNPRTCQHVGLTEERLRSADYQSEELWEMITKCLKLASIRVLVIMLDHIEEIFLQSRTDDPNRFSRFVEKFNYHIGTLFREHGVIVKTMVTCRLGEAALHFYEVQALSIVKNEVMPSTRIVWELDLELNVCGLELASFLHGSSGEAQAINELQIVIKIYTEKVDHGILTII